MSVTPLNHVCNLEIFVPQDNKSTVCLFCICMCLSICVIRRQHQNACVYAQLPKFTNESIG